MIDDVEFSTVKAKTQLQRPDVRIRNPSTNEILEKVRSNVPDLLSFNARLQPSAHTADDATLAFFFRRGQPFPGTSAVTWAINFEHGEVKVDSPTTISFEAGPNEKPITIHVHRYNDDSVEAVEWSWSPELLALPLPARSVAATLYAFADGRPAGDGWVSLEDAAHRADLIEKLFNV